MRGAGQIGRQVAEARVGDLVRAVGVVGGGLEAVTVALGDLGFGESAGRGAVPDAHAEVVVVARSLDRVRGLGARGTVSTQ